MVSSPAPADPALALFASLGEPLQVNGNNLFPTQYTRFYFQISPEFLGEFAAMVKTSGDTDLVTFPDGGVYGVRVDAPSASYYAYYKANGASGNAQLGNQMDLDQSGYSATVFQGGQRRMVAWQIAPDSKTNILLLGAVATQSSNERPRSPLGGAGVAIDGRIGLCKDEGDEKITITHTFED